MKLDNSILIYFNTFRKVSKNEAKIQKCIKATERIEEINMHQYGRAGGGIRCDDQ